MHKRAEEANNGAIQTEYAGHLFRSRLEARWAVFFDHAGIKWQYEFQGYECKGHRYLPDFYLPDSNDFVEVKGDPEGLQKDYERMSVILGESSPLPGFIEGKSSLILLGDVPVVTQACVFHRALCYRHSAFLSTWCSFAPSPSGTRIQPYKIELGFLSSVLGLHTHRTMGVNGLLVESKTLETPYIFRNAIDAYDAARKARFEHGECGGRR